jgi:hypothetical protein
MTLTQLKYVMDSFNEGSFTNAGVINQRTQASVSLMIKNLEDELGFKLFERNPNAKHGEPTVTVTEKCCLEVLPIIDNILYLVKKLESLKVGSQK